MSYAFQSIGQLYAEHGVRLTVSVLHGNSTHSVITMRMRAKRNQIESSHFNDDKKHI